MTTITLPNGWKPRPYQMPMWSYLEKGGKRAIGAWHRRAGKDDVLLNWTAVAAFERPASYWHCLPEYSQARKAIWTAVDPMTGVRRIDQAFPMDLRANTNDQEMFIRFKNGSTWQCVGSDRYNSLVGAGVAGVTFSEFALANPSAWAYIRPMVEANDGWAAFISTPRGRNHFKDLMDMAARNKSWFQEALDVHKTGALSLEQIEESKAEYIALYGEDLGTAQFDQEYLVSFNAAILGAFYAREMQKVRAEGRISDTLKAVEGKSVHRAWDIGVRDDTSIWWFQVIGGSVHILDCYSQSGVGLDHYADIVQKRREEYGWKDGTDYVPHDAKVKEWTSGRTRVETMMEYGLKPQVVPMATKLDGVNAVRRTLPVCIFHSRCEAEGIAALEQYRREWDDDKKAFKASEVHDWSSHLCFTGDTEVLTRNGTYRIMDLPETGEVLTRCGWSQYHSPRMTRKNAQLVAVQFSDGLTVKCTPDHSFLTESGWKSAESLEMGSKILCASTPSRSFSTAIYTAYTQATDTLRKVALAFTETFGRTRSDLSQKVATFTTRTTIQQTTCSTIWSAYPQAITCSALSQVAKEEAGSLNSLLTLANARLTGTDQKKVGSGTSDMLNVHSHGQSGSESQRTAYRVVSSFKRLFARGLRKSIAPRTAKWRTIECVRFLSETDDVWCLTVPSERSFALSNGAIVHNCDAFRYLSLSWRKAVVEYEPPPRPEIGHMPNTLDEWIAPPLVERRGRR